MALSMMLFFNASATSFLVFACEIIINYLMVQFMLRQKGSQAKLIAAIIITFDVAILGLF